MFRFFHTATSYSNIPTKQLYRIVCESASRFTGDNNHMKTTVSNMLYLCVQDTHACLNAMKVLREQNTNPSNISVCRTWYQEVEKVCQNMYISAPPIKHFPEIGEMNKLVAKIFNNETVYSFVTELCQRSKVKDPNITLQELGFLLR